jgi:nitroreductase
MSLSQPLPSDVGRADTLTDDALSLRYGVADKPDAILWNDRIAGLLDHRSVRSYRAEPLPDDLVSTLVAAAQSAPSSSNLQLWSVVAVTDPVRKASLAELAGNQTHIVKAPLLLVWIADLARAHAIAEEAAAPIEGFAYLESFLAASVDAALAAQNALNAAESLGFGTVFIGGMRNKPEEVSALLTLPPQAVALFGLLVGRPDDSVPTAVKPRLPQEAVLHREQYTLDRHAAWHAYDETSRIFQQSQGLPPVGWIAQLLQRGRSAASLNGRDRLWQALRNLSFGLR